MKERINQEMASRFREVFDYLRSMALIHSQQDLADAVGVDKSHLSKAMKGVVSALNPTFIGRLNNVYNGMFNEDYILTGKGSMLANNTDGIVAGRDNSGDNKSNNGDNRDNVINNYYGECPEKKEQEQIRKMDFRPRIPIEVAAGSLAVIAEDGVNRQDCEMFPKIGQFPSYDFTTFVRGDSMEPKFERGAEIACKRVNGSGFIQWGRVHVLDTSQGAVIKQIYDEEDSIRCKSFNPIYPDFLVPKEEIYSINLVVGKLTFE